MGFNESSKSLMRSHPLGLDSWCQDTGNIPVGIWDTRGMFMGEGLDAEKGGKASGILNQLPGV